MTSRESLGTVQSARVLFAAQCEREEQNPQFARLDMGGTTNAERGMMNKELSPTGNPFPLFLLSLFDFSATLTAFSALPILRKSQEYESGACSSTG